MESILWTICHISYVLRGYSGMAQKVVEWEMSHVKSYAAYDMHEKSRWLNFKMAQNLGHVFLLRWLNFSIIKTEIAQKSDRDFEPSRFLMHIICSIAYAAYDFMWVSFNEFKSNLTIPPVFDSYNMDHILSTFYSHIVLLYNIWKLMYDCQSEIYNFWSNEQ